jgi:hypothetical protein
MVIERKSDMADAIEKPTAIKTQKTTRKRIMRKYLVDGMNGLKKPF